MVHAKSKIICHVFHVVLSDSHASSVSICKNTSEYVQTLLSVTMLVKLVG